jgi:hypothetical protein
MKKLLLLFILLTCSQMTLANEDFCFTGMEGPNFKAMSSTHSFQKSNIRCETRDSLVVALQAGTLTLGTITALCTWAPEPALTKVSAAVIATTGLIVNYATFLVRNMPCNSSGERDLNDYEKTEFLVKMCKAMSKEYNHYTEKCE